MVDITPYVPYAEDIRFPYLDFDGEIHLSSQRPSPSSPYSAGRILDDVTLEQSIPFGSFRDSYEPGNRSLGFTVARVAEVYKIPEPVQFYSSLVAQLLGALRYEASKGDELVGYYYFDLSECPLESSGGGLHYDGESNDPDNTKAVVSNLLPTLYVLEEPRQPEQPKELSREIDPSRIDTSLLWCANDKEITVHQGLTFHGSPISPREPHTIRRFASLVPCRVIDPVEKTRVMIDDQYFKFKHAAKLLDLSAVNF